MPHPALPQMRLENVEFGEGDHDVVMNIFIKAQVEIVLPPFASRKNQRSENGGS